jgi:hypothetical protein
MNSGHVDGHSSEMQSHPIDMISQRSLRSPALVVDKSVHVLLGTNGSSILQFPNILVSTISLIEGSPVLGNVLFFR